MYLSSFYAKFINPNRTIGIEKGKFSQKKT